MRIPFPPPYNPYTSRTCKHHIGEFSLHLINIPILFYWHTIHKKLKHLPPLMLRNAPEEKWTY